MTFTFHGTALLLSVLWSQPGYASDWPSGFSKCADEGEACKAGSSMRQISFGIKNKWLVKNLSGNIACTVATFGSDPYPGLAKKCAVGPTVISASASTTTTPPPTSTSTSTSTSSLAYSTATTDSSLDTAPATGWASQNGGTSGGRAAAASAIYKVNSASQLLAALKAQGNAAKIIKLYGTIDMTSADNGGPFTSASDQAARNAIRLPGNTTLIGVGSDAKVVNASIKIKDVENVIVRNLTIVNPCDINPLWDSNDGSSGNWNSQYDGVTIDGARHVWIDHNVFTDAPQTDDKLPVAYGKTKQCHDGALDVKNGADYVTVSNNRFELHQKNNLIGSSDSTTSDEGHLTVTFHGNYFVNVSERAPRVRFGKVHVYNNYYEGNRAYSAYPHYYSIGVGYKAKIISQNNAFDIAGATSCPDVVKNPGSSSKTGAITDTGSLLNGTELSLAGSCHFSSAVGWTMPYSVNLLPAAEVKQAVKSNAGVGKLTVN